MMLKRKDRIECHSREDYKNVVKHIMNERKTQSLSGILNAILRNKIYLCTKKKKLKTLRKVRNFRLMVFVSIRCLPSGKSATHGNEKQFDRY